MAPNTRNYRYLALVSHILLLLWVVIWQFFLTTTHGYSALFISLVYIVPLLLPLKGIMQAKPYTHAWASFVVLFYLMHGCTVAYAVPSERIYAIIELILCCSMFIGCSAFARKRGRELGLGLKKLKQVMQEEKDYFEKGK